MNKVVQGDILAQPVDLIVNAANSALLPGGGVCGAIFSKAGQEVVDECEKIGSCPTGHVVLTGAGKAPFKGIIHAVGPIWQGGSQNEEELLASAYWNAMTVAYKYMREHGLKHISIAFPCISTGIYGYPAKEAAQIAISTIKKIKREYPDTQNIDVYFVTYSDQDTKIYRSLL